MYLVIFLTISLMVQKVTDSDDTVSFEQTSLDIAVIDRDGGELAKGLYTYLDTYHNIQNLPDDKSILQDKLFYRDIYYIVTIPENFEEACLKNQKTLAVTKVPGTANGYYVDQQINTFLNSVKLMTESGFSLTEAIISVQENAEVEPKVTLIDRTGHGGELPGFAYMFQYMPYILMSILCYVLSYINMAFNKTDVKKRLECSAVTNRRQTSQFILGYAVVGLIVWCICTILPFLFYHDSFTNDSNLPYYLLNTLALALVSLALAYMAGTFIHREELVSAVINVLTLGMSFLCGVFVPLDVMGKSIKTVTQFLPVYWYETNNLLLSRNSTLSSSQLHSLYMGYGIQMLFAIAFLGIALMVGRSQRQSAN